MLPYKKGEKTEQIFMVKVNTWCAHFHAQNYGSRKRDIDLNDFPSLASKGWLFISLSHFFPYGSQSIQ